MGWRDPRIRVNYSRLLTPRTPRLPPHQPKTPSQLFARIIVPHPARSISVSTAARKEIVVETGKRGTYRSDVGLSLHEQGEKYEATGRQCSSPPSSRRDNTTKSLPSSASVLLHVCQSSFRLPFVRISRHLVILILPLGRALVQTWLVSNPFPLSHV